MSRAGVRQDSPASPGRTEIPPSTRSAGDVARRRPPRWTYRPAVSPLRVPLVAFPALWSPRALWAPLAARAVPTPTSPRWPTTRAPSCWTVSSTCAASRPTSPLRARRGRPTARWPLGASTHPWLSHVPECGSTTFAPLWRPPRRLAGDPTAELAMVGITGTNGKTTTSYLTRADCCRLLAQNRA